MNGPVENPWGKFRRARRVFVLATVVALLLLAAERLLKRHSGLVILGYVALAPFMFWSVWQLERFACPRCGKRFVNLLRHYPDDSSRCQSCGLRVGEACEARFPDSSLFQRYRS